MSTYQYRVVPAPTKGVKARGVKTAEARFAHALEEVMNRMAGDGWEYQRAETLPSLERAGLTSTTTEWRNVLVFRKANAEQALEQRVYPVPQIVEIQSEPKAMPALETGDSDGETPPEPRPLVAERTVVKAED
jgi:hypothetical protein